MKPCPYCGQATYRPSHLAEHIAEEYDISFEEAMDAITPPVDEKYEHLV